MTFTFSHLLGLVVALGVAVIAGAADASQTDQIRPPHPLVWEAMELSVVAKPEEKEAKFEFRVTNQSAGPVEVVQIEPSCGCTVAEMPSTPWVLAGGAKGAFTAVVDFQGKHGKLVKTLRVHSSGGTQLMTMKIDIPETEEGR